MASKAAMKERLAQPVRADGFQKITKWQSPAEATGPYEGTALILPLATSWDTRRFVLILCYQIGEPSFLSFVALCYALSISTGDAIPIARSSHHGPCNDLAIGRGGKRQ